MHENGRHVRGHKHRPRHAGGGTFEDTQQRRLKLNGNPFASEVQTRVAIFQLEVSLVLYLLFGRLVFPDLLV